MSVGAVVLATDQGLGYLAKDFYDQGLIDQVFIHPHSSRKAHYEWYSENDICDSVDQLLNISDTLLFFENPFYWKLIPRSREKGKKTVLMVMYECTPYPLFYQPDLVLSPSALDKDYYPDSIQVPVPVSEEWRMRERARIFVHNAGNGGLGGRNGTREVIEAMKYVKSPIKLILRTQGSLQPFSDSRICVYSGSVSKSELYTDGDVFLFPERFNGLSLPLQEAFASGMAVMAGDRYPVNTWLPKEILIPVEKYTKERIACEFQCASYDPRTIAKTIDAWYDKPISHLSLMGKTWAENNSWKQLREQYEKLLSAS